MKLKHCLIALSILVTSSLCAQSNLYTLEFTGTTNDTVITSAKVQELIRPNDMYVEAGTNAIAATFTLVTPKATFALGTTVTTNGTTLCYKFPDVFLTSEDKLVISDVAQGKARLMYSWILRQRPGVPSVVLNQ